MKFNKVESVTFQLSIRLKEKPSAMRPFITIIFILVIAHSGFGQELSAKIIDSQTKEPIPYATIQTANNDGVISNEEGVFIIPNIESIKTIQVSCMGYQTQSFNIEMIKSNDFILSLKPAINQLNTVYLSNSRPNIDSIIASVKKNLSKNYPTDSLDYHFFYRETKYIDFENLDFEVERARHIKAAKIERANNQLDSMAYSIKNGNIIHFTDYSGNLFALDEDHSKLSVDEVIKILNSKRNVSFEAIQEEAQAIVLNYLDSTKTYKLKTGLFKVEDSLSIGDEFKNSDKSDEVNITDLKNSTQSLIKHSNHSNGMLKTLLDKYNYSYTLKNVNSTENGLVYLIDFEPKRGKAHFSGSMYVNDDDYAVLKLTYKFAEGKRGQKFNLKLLLGVKFIEDHSEGVVLFEKTSQDTYQPKYIKRETGQYFYVHRPLKFIENSLAKRKTSFDFKISGNTKSREELLISNVSQLDHSIYDKMVEEKSIKFKNQRKYDASIWAGKETLAPTEELKTYEVEDE